jgi:hypothetical protein
MSPESPIAGDARPGALPPAFSSRESCRLWLAAQRRDGAAQFQAALQRQLERLDAQRMAARERFAILELLREPVSFASTQTARLFADRPLPLKPPEQDALASTLATWHGLASGYERCLQACVDHEPSTEGLLAATAQRALAALVELQLACYRGGRQPAPGHWRRLHCAYAVAESARLGEEPVADPVHRDREPATPFSTWVESLLLQLASLHELPARQIGWVADWARRWSDKLVARREAAPAEGAAPLYVDLEADRPAGYRPLGSASQRVLDTTKLKASLKNTVLLLENGLSPTELGLCDDCVASQARTLLTRTYFHWCKGGAVRKHHRHSATGHCIVVGGFELAHFHLAGGKRPTGPLSDDQIRRQREELAVFGRLLSDSAPAASGESRKLTPGERATAESWRIVDQSASGLRLVRPIDRDGRRVISKELVAVRTDDMKVMYLGTVRRATISADDTLDAGVSLLAGRPVPVAVREGDLNAGRSPPAPAFLLPAIPALSEPPSVVLPSGWFRRERVLDVLSGDDQRIRLTGLIERGSDFERATFDALSH